MTSTLNPPKDLQINDPTLKSIFIHAQNRASFFAVIPIFVLDFLLFAGSISHEGGCIYNPDRGSFQYLKSTLSCN